MLPGARAARSRRRTYASRVSTGHVVMVLAGVLGALLTLNVLRAADTTTPVLVAAKDLTPGTLIDADAVRVAHVHVDRNVLAALFPATALDDLRGQVATSTVHKGSLLSRDQLQAVDGGAAERLMSFPLSRAHAVAGKIDAGDRVDVLAVERDTGRSGYVVTNVPVVAVEGGHSGPLDTNGDLTITVSVDAGDAGRLAAAVEVATVTLVRSTGAPPLQDADEFRPSGTSLRAKP
jgi:Flp pilus assembly protein CpaB